MESDLEESVDLVSGECDVQSSNEELNDHKQEVGTNKKRKKTAAQYQREYRLRQKQKKLVAEENLTEMYETLTEIQKQKIERKKQMDAQKQRAYRQRQTQKNCVEEENLTEIQKQEIEKKKQLNAQRQREFRQRRKNFNFADKTDSEIEKQKKLKLQSLESSKRYRDKLKAKKLEDLSATIDNDFSKFPKDTMKEKWIEATGRINWMPVKTSTICSENLSEKCFLISKKGNRYLTISTAVPTLRMTKESEPAKTSTENEGKSINFPRCDECKRPVDARELYRCVQCPLVVMCADCGRSNAHAHHCVLRMPSLQIYNKVEYLFELLTDVFHKKLSEEDVDNIANDDGDDDKDHGSDNDDNEEEMEQELEISVRQEGDCEDQNEKAESQMDSERKIEEPSTQNAKGLNYSAEYGREYNSRQRDASQPEERAEFLLKEAQRLPECRSRQNTTTSQPTETKTKWKRYRVRQQPAERAEFLSKEAQRLREYRARKKSTSLQSTKMEAEYKKEYRARQRATSQPEERAEFLSKEAQRLRDYRARKKGLPKSDVVTTVPQVQLVNDKATDKSLSDEDNDPHLDVLWAVPGPSKKRMSSASTFLSSWRNEASAPEPPDEAIPISRIKTEPDTDPLARPQLFNVLHKTSDEPKPKKQRIKIENAPKEDNSTELYTVESIENIKIKEEHEEMVEIKLEPLDSDAALLDTEKYASYGSHRAGNTGL